VPDPPDPACADRVVEGVELIILTPNGHKVSSLHTDSAGHTSILLSPGTYAVQPQRVQGLLGTPAPVALTVDRSNLEVAIGYDAGIRMNVLSTSVGETLTVATPWSRPSRYARASHPRSILFIRAG
jgi:hypothetical protein